jgi:hypothetical protein
MKRIALLLPLILLFPPPAFAGKIFGNLKEGGRSVGQGWEVRITCPGSAPYATTTDEYGAYNINVPNNRCALSVKYSDNQWTDTVAIVSSDDPARYDFDLVKENGRYVLKRR